MKQVSTKKKSRVQVHIYYNYGSEKNNPRVRHSVDLIYFGHFFKTIILSDIFFTPETFVKKQ